MPRKIQLRSKKSHHMLQCQICNHNCIIPPEQTGYCGVHKNTGKKIELLVYGKSLGVNRDPIEKKPLYHFFPGTEIFSFGTAGCNFRCTFCQNRQMSQAKEFPEIIYEGELRLPQKIVDYCKKNTIKSIAYTYNEPTVFFEYAYDTMKLAKKNGIKNVRVSNGFMSKKCLEKIEQLVDAMNIDIKGYTEEFYKNICGAKLQAVLDNIQRCRKHKIRIEITTLIIPGYNDEEKTLEGIARFIANISLDIPWHLSAFFPTYKMLNVPPTSIETLQKGYDIGKKIGLHYIYIGNIRNNGHEDTICPQCKFHVIERKGFFIKNHLQDGACPKCNFQIPGKWK